MNKYLAVFKLTCFFILVLLIHSCKNQDQYKNPIEFSVKNSELYYFIDADSSALTLKFKNEKERILSTNEVIFEIKNNTQQKLLFMVNDEHLAHIYNMRINVFEDDSLILGKVSSGNPIIEDPVEDSISSYKFEQIMKKVEANSKKLYALGARQNFALFDAFIHQSIVIGKNEKRTFKSEFKFPYTCELLINDNITPFGFRIKKNKKYSFSIEYKVDKKEVEKELTRKQLDSLKKEHIEIFSGSITSNRIPMINWKK